MALRTPNSPAESHNGNWVVRTLLLSILASGCAHKPNKPTITESEQLTINTLQEVALNSNKPNEIRIEAINGLRKFRRASDVALKTLIDLAKTDQNCAGIAATAALSGEEFEIYQCPDTDK